MAINVDKFAELQTLAVQKEKEREKEIQTAASINCENGLNHMSSYVQDKVYNEQITAEGLTFNISELGFVPSVHQIMVELVGGAGPNRNLWDEYVARHAKRGLQFQARDMVDSDITVDVKFDKPKGK